jgi:flavorubredoxin
MIKYEEIKKDIYWVGVIDYDIEVFDIIMRTEYGTTYNSYLVKGENKTALFETVKETFFDEFMERLSGICTPADIDYIVVDHTEPDHAGSIARLLEMNPNITVIGTSIALKYLENITNMSFEHIVAKPDTVIDLGSKTIKFISAPNLHWPDSMYSYIEEDKLLITCDSFGCHYASDKVFNDLIGDDFMDAYRYYFDVIMGPFKPFVLKALEKIEPLDIDIICPGHGPVLRTNLEKYTSLYKEWASDCQANEPFVVIAYVSAYGYTKKLAEKISEGIQSSGITVKLYDLVDADHEEVIAQMNRAKGILFGSPTLLSDTLPPIWNLLGELNPLIHKGKIAGAFGSYGWSGEAVPNIEARLKQLRFKLPVEGLKIKFNPSEDELTKALEFGVNFSENII